MENTDKHILRFYVALFSSILLHSIFLLFLFITFPDFKPEKKTIPFQLISNERFGQKSSASQMSRTENTLAAQEFLRTLNESTFEQLIKNNTSKSNGNDTTPSPFKSENTYKNTNSNQPYTLPQKNNANIFEGLQNIFSKKQPNQNNSNNIQQITTKTLEQLSEYEILLLQKLAKNELYDKFHPVMHQYKQTNIDYIITLQLLSNGAIKNAQITKSSSIKEIDYLAVNAAYLASPYPKPPPEDIKIDFKYDIPIIYQKNTQ